MSRHSNSLAFLVAGETRLATLSQRVNLKSLRPLLLYTAKATGSVRG